MSSQGTARRSQSFINFSSHSANAANNITSDEIVQASKRLRTENTANNPVITINTEDAPFTRGNTTTEITNKPMNIDEDNSNIIKLNRLHDKNDRYESHVSFLQNCLEINRVPHGLVINLEPSIGNHDEAFRSKWYQRLQEFSFTLMKDIIEYSTTVTEETFSKISTEHESLKKSLKPDDYKEVNEALQQNSINRKRILKQNKQKKFHHLKYHRTMPTRQANYATKDLARTATETRPRTYEHPSGNWQTQQQGSRQPLSKPWSSLFKNNSRTNVRQEISRTDQRNYDRTYKNAEQHPAESSETTQKQIQDLRNEISALKTAKTSNETPKNVPGVSSWRRNNGKKEQTQDLKKKEAPDVSQIMTFLHTTMQTLTEFKSYFEEQQHIRQTLSGM